MGDVALRAYDCAHGITAGDAGFGQVAAYEPGFARDEVALGHFGESRIEQGNRS